MLSLQYFLIARAQVSYGNSGSGQQSVTSVSAVDDTNSLWTIHGTPDSPVIKKDDFFASFTYKMNNNHYFFLNFLIFFFIFFFYYYFRKCAAGDAIKNGQFIRLKHVGTGKRLHSHLHKSPLSKQQEVNVFADARRACSARQPFCWVCTFSFLFIFIR